MPEVSTPASDPLKTNLDNTEPYRCAKALDRGSARLCCLAKDCENPEYTQLVRALCDEGNVHLIMVRIRSGWPSARNLATPERVVES